MLFLIFLVLLSIHVAAQETDVRNYPVVMMKQGKVILETGGLKIKSLQIIYGETVLMKRIPITQSTEQLPPFFNEAGTYTLIFNIRGRKKIVRMLIVL